MGKFNDIVSRFTNPTSDDVYANSAGNATKTDCATCKIISGGGLVATSLYIAYHTMQQNTKTKRALLSSVSAVVFYLGCARIMELPPFANKPIKANNQLIY